jgi:NO-binding membrane sensor protein with MHYT domain
VLLSSDLKHMSLQNMRQNGKVLVVLKALTSRPGYLIIGGSMLGLSLPVTQYLSILALETSASIHLRIEWCAAVVIISVFCSATAFWVMFRCAMSALRAPLLSGLGLQIR